MKYPILGRERRRPIALSAVGTVLVLAFACVLFTLTVLAIQPGLLPDTLAAFWEDKLLILLNIFPVCVVLIVCYCLTGNAFSAAGIGGLTPGHLTQLLHQGCVQVTGIHASGAQDADGHIVAFPQDARQQVLRAHVAVAQLTGCLLGKPQGLLRPGRKFVLIHSVLPSFPWESPVYLFSFCSL